jgi:D-alanyl-D-alanine carboxypeptidase
VPNGDNITLAELLEMRSGLYDYAGAPELPPIFDNDPTRVWAPQELLAISFAQPANFPPGTSYEYSNTNDVLLGLVVEKVDGRPLAKAMQKRLFRPLGLSDTVYPASASNVIPRPFAHGYLYGSSSVVITTIPDPPYTPEYQAAIEAGTVQPTDHTSLNLNRPGSRDCCGYWVTAPVAVVA